MPQIFVTATVAGAAAFEALRPRALHRFTALPILVFDANAVDAARLGATPGLHAHAHDYDSALPILTYLDAVCAGRAPAIPYNLSISYGPGKLDPTEPIALATLLAARAGAVGVVAAGNDGPAEATISPWASAPWLIGVGATEDDGATLLPMSSVGRAGDPASGPHVVAPGRAVVPLRPFEARNHGTAVALIVAGRDGAGRATEGYADTPVVGTSFAAPRVTRICAQLLALRALHHDLATLVARRLPSEARSSDYIAACAALAGAPRLDAPGAVFLDGLAGAVLAPLLRLLAASALFGAAGAGPLVASDEPEPVATLRRMLAAMARPLPGLGRHQAGAGFVSDAIAGDWLAAVDALAWTRLLRGDVPAGLGQYAGAAEPVFGPDLVDEIRRRCDDTLQLTDTPVV